MNFSKTLETLQKLEQMNIGTDVHKIETLDDTLVVTFKDDFFFEEAKELVTAESDFIRKNRDGTVTLWILMR